MRVLPPVSALELAGVTEPPEPGTPEERDAVRRVLDGIAATVATAVAEAHDAAEPRPGTRKRMTVAHDAVPLSVALGPPAGAG